MMHHVKRLLALALRQVDDAIADVHLRRCRRAELQIRTLESWWAL